MELTRLSAVRSFSLQLPVDSRADAKLIQRSWAVAQDRVLAFAKLIYPWVDLSKLEAAKEADLRQEAPQMIAAWYRHFEPENLEAYLTSLQKEG